MDRTPKTRKEAAFLRVATGTTKLVTTANRAVAALAAKGIPSLVCGGLAVQEYGYPRLTVDVDLIVPNVAAAYKVLSIAGFKPSRETPGVTGFMVDRENKIELDLLPAGHSLGGPVVFPMPHNTASTPKLISLQDLVSLKLSSHSASPLHRAKDFSDVVELVKRRKLPRDLPVDGHVQQAWLALWDGLQAEVG